MRTRDGIGVLTAPPPVSRPRVNGTSNPRTQERVSNDHSGHSGHGDAEQQSQSAGVQMSDTQSVGTQSAGTQSAATQEVDLDRSTAQAAFISAFLDLIPDPARLPLEPPEIWNHLGLWQNRIVDEQMVDPEWMVTRLARLDNTLLEAITRWLDLTVEQPTVTRMAEAIAERAVAERAVTGGVTTSSVITGGAVTNRANADQAPSWAQMLFLLDTLVHNRSHQAIDEVAQLVLAPSCLSNQFQKVLTPRSRRLVIALQLYVTNPADLGLMMLHERAERFSYNRHILVEEPHAPEAKHRNLAVQSTHTQPTPAGEPPLLHSDIDQILATFEAGPRGGRHSRCLRILHQAPDTQVIFIRRVLRQSSITEMERTLFGDEVETIVLKFHHGMSVLEERSTKGVGVVIAQAIAKAALKCPATYHRDRVRAPATQLRGFLSALRHNEDPMLTFVELNLRSAPVSGSPVLLLRGSQAQPLPDALAGFEANDLFLLEEVEDIRHVGVSYEARIQGKAHRHIFKIRFDRIANSGGANLSGANQVTASYMAAQASTAICTHFEEHMRTHHDIIVVPAAR